MTFAALIFIGLTFVASTASAGPGLATVYEKCTKPNVVALTFDDGPWIYGTKLVQMLDKEGIKASFFVNGNNFMYECIYGDSAVSSIKTAFAKGHEFLSHTWNHYDLAKLSFDKLHDEMWRTELALQRIIGVQPAIMRPPFGSYSNLVREVSAMRNQSLALWDFDSGDSVGVSPENSKKEYASLAARHPASVLALNHETQSSTVNDVIPAAIASLRNAGYTFVTISECLGVAPYQWVRDPQQRTADWKCNT